MVALGAGVELVKLLLERWMGGANETSYNADG